MTLSNLATSCALHSDNISRDKSSFTALCIVWPLIIATKYRPWPGFLAQLSPPQPYLLPCLAIVGRCRLGTVSVLEWPLLGGLLAYFTTLAGRVGKGLR